MAQVPAKVSLLAVAAACAALVAVGCAPQTAPHAQGTPAAATERSSAPSQASPSPPAAHDDVSPPPPVSVQPGGEPEAHPHAPESLPNKPETIPEEMPGATPPN